MTRRPDVVVNTIGPFQGADYRVAEACIEAGIHYIDLSNSHQFVAGIAQLDGAARAAGRRRDHRRQHRAGAVSRAVVAEAGLAPTSVRIGISPAIARPGDRAWCGRSSARPGRSCRRCAPAAGRRCRAGARCTGAASASTATAASASAGCRPATRPISCCCPGCIQQLKAVDFYAGLELSILHVGLWLLSWLVKRGWLKSLLPLHRPLHWIADQLHPLGSDRGGMLVDVEGINADGRPMSYRWRLVAEKGQGRSVAGRAGGGAGRAAGAWREPAGGRLSVPRHPRAGRDPGPGRAPAGLHSCPQQGSQRPVCARHAPRFQPPAGADPHHSQPPAVRFGQRPLRCRPQRQSARAPDPRLVPHAARRA